MIPGVPPHARAAYAALALAIEEAGSTPCMTDPELWFSTDPAERAFAASACHRCPVCAQCGTYADAAGERHGTWAGVARDARPTTRLKETA